MRRLWDIQWCWNGWLSLGFHLDHTDPSITLHMPVLIVAFGHLKQPGFQYGLRGRWGIRDFSLWVEGYVATGESCCAYYLGTFRAKSFGDAVEAWKRTQSREVQRTVYKHDKGPWVYWERQIFDNEAQARVSFG